MSDSFRAQKAADQKALSSIEDSFSHLTRSPPSPTSSPLLSEPPPSLTESEERDQTFRIACGAYVKGLQKPGVRVKHDLDVARDKLEEGGDANSRDGDGWTALHWAVSEEYLPVVRFLLSHKVASSSPSSSTAVSSTAVDSTAVDVNATDTSGCSPLWVAAYNGVYSTAVLLLFAGAALDLKGKAHGTSVCTASTAARSMRNSSIANLIDAEEGMRKEDGEREGALRRGEVDERAFRVQLKEAVAASMSGKRK